MPLYRADFDVKASRVLEEGQGPWTLRSADPDCEMVLRNAKKDASGHVPHLQASIIGKAENIEVVPNLFRDWLARQLDILTYVTHDRFSVDQCRRVIEWEPYKRERQCRVLQEFPDRDPPQPGFPEPCFALAQRLAEIDMPSHVRRAMESFRLGVIIGHPDEQFLQFWMAIEVLAEGAKGPILVPVTCPACAHALHCPRCDQTPERRPIAQEAIRDLIRRIGKGDPEATFRRLRDARNHIMHGRSMRSIEKRLGRTMSAIMNEAAFVAWNGILTYMPVQGLAFMHQGGDFTHMRIVAGPRITFDHTGPGPQPAEERLPEVSVELITAFRGPPESDTQGTG